MPKEYESFFGLGVTRPTFAPSDRLWHPLTDVFETDEDIVVIVEVAGIEDADLNLTLEKGFLIIRGFRREIHGLFKKRQYYTMEIDYGPFERIIRLPDYAYESDVQAQMKNGLLVITVKKSSAPGECREIKIK